MRRRISTQIQRLRLKKLAWLRVTWFWNFGTPYNFETNQTIGFKFGTEMEDRTVPAYGP